MILLDTCAVIWLAFSPGELSKAAVEAIDLGRREGGLAISGISLYEVAWLAVHNRIDLTIPLDAALSQIEANFIVLPVSAAVARLAAELPSSYPGDPMDRMIGATALARGVPLVTKDRAIRRSKALEVIW